MRLTVHHLTVQQEEVSVGGQTIEVGSRQVYYLLDEQGVATKKLKLLAADESVAHGVACGGAGEQVRIEEFGSLVREGRLVPEEQYRGPVVVEPLHAAEP